MKQSQKILVAAVVSAVMLGGCATSDQKKPVTDASGQSYGMPSLEGFNSKTLSQAESEINNPSAYTADQRKNLARKLMKVRNVIFFGFDSYKLSPESKKNADKIASILKNHPRQTLRIEGHTDPRGSEQYNFNLGQKRAVALKDYLVKQGVSKNQLCTVSYGELRPATSVKAQGGNKKKAYKLDRRDELDFGEDCSDEK